MTRPVASTALAWLSSRAMRSCSSGARSQGTAPVMTPRASRRRSASNSPDWFEAYVAFEAEATTFDDFQPLYVPGLLETEDYARAVLEAGWPHRGNRGRHRPPGRPADGAPRHPRHGR